MTKNNISFYVVDASEELTMNIKEASEKKWRFCRYNSLL
ncbi:hypothetical protein LM5923_0132 [Listeria monocytogenes 08-5923]|nr:hypothetical protein LM5578_0132 [Listeria monocytogenes 08-5578]ADB69978.1 hypothetical protein LM5923_0132 [Listeria monocytogenes 08-5923]RKB04718.1 hypothetical protein JU58_02062 [Listeria monocytogenes]RKC98580.1 hypothetical protein AF818_00774 [Listeria monocytogenes]CWU31072.1 Uncharacterised protein [Listeria monocytogenes]